jgi:PAS domain S-box-containing protein
LNPDVPPKITDCNPAAVKTFGYTRQEMLGRSIAFLHVNEATMKKFQENLYPTVEDCGYYYLSEFEMKRKDGTVFPTEHSVFFLQNDQGIRIGWVSVVRDITERKKAEKALRESEERFRDMAENISEVFWLFDCIEQKVIYVNPAYETILFVLMVRYAGYRTKVLLLLTKMEKYVELLVLPRILPSACGRKRRCGKVENAMRWPQKRPGSVYGIGIFKPMNSISTQMLRRF